MKVDLDELERKARAAEQDEWRWRGGVLEGVNNGQVVLWAPDGNDDTDEPALIVSVSDAAYIAAASPPVVQALIARIHDLEAALDGALALASTPERNQDESWDRAFRAHLATLEKGTVRP